MKKNIYTSLFQRKRKTYSKKYDKKAECLVALRSDPPLANLTVREQGYICGHITTDIPIVPDRVGAGRPPVAGSRGYLFHLRRQRPLSGIEPATS